MDVSKFQTAVSGVPTELLEQIGKLKEELDALAALRDKVSGNIYILYRCIYLQCLFYNLHIFCGAGIGLINS